jgi:hypothetical protein
MVNTLAAMHNLKGKKIDFTQAFPQAKLQEDIYLPFPAGFEHKNEKWALKLKYNLYGLIQASRNWFLKLSAIYERLGFKQSKSDQCLFLKKRHDYRSLYRRLSTIHPRHKRNRIFRENTA